MWELLHRNDCIRITVLVITTCKGKGVPVRVIKAYGGMRGVAPLMNLSTGQKRADSFTPRSLYTHWTDHWVRGCSREKSLAAA